MPTPYDDNAEMRAMILLALPFPPLPVNARAMPDDQSALGEEVCITSHDIISKLLEENTLIKQTAIHAQRKQRQIRVLRNFMSQLLELESQREIQPRELYDLYARYTINHIETFFPEGADSGVRLRNIDSIQHGDQTHKRMCDYMAGQAVLLGLEEQTQERWMNVSYPAMLMAAKSRLITEAAQPEPGVEPLF